MQHADIEPRYHIDPERSKEINRSFMVLASSRLCPECQGKVELIEGNEVELGRVIGECCAKKLDYIGPRLPVMETLFRLMLANSNEPLTLRELNQQLRDIRAGNFVPSVDVLQHLLEHDVYYGFKQIPMPEAEIPLEEDSDNVDGEYDDMIMHLDDIEGQGDEEVENEEGDEIDTD
ncbi:MAG: hypothetical protein SVY53_12880 [Chloroflexota bacterium]|nr:hypothetical protein [Chloroflexota bacterium]